MTPDRDPAPYHGHGDPHLPPHRHRRAGRLVRWPDVLRRPMTKPQAARETPACPCNGACHHAERPCSLGCWSAQKPWRPEEARAALLDDLEVAVSDMAPYQYPVHANGHWRRDVLALIQQHREGNP